MLKGIKLKAHYSTDNTTLSEAYMQHNTIFFVGHININWQMFEDMVDVVHIYEKWFNLTLNKHK